MMDGTVEIKIPKKATMGVAVVVTGPMLDPKSSKSAVQYCRPGETLTLFLNNLGSTYHITERKLEEMP